MNTRRNLLFVGLALVLSLITASHFGTWYDKFSPQYGGWTTSKEGAVDFAGFILSYVFFIPLIFGIFGIKQNKKWILWLLIPVLVLVLSADQYHFYIPLGLVLAGGIIGYILNLLGKKLFVRRPTSPTS